MADAAWHITSQGGDRIMHKVLEGVTVDRKLRKTSS